jgi:hypothetical protein
MPEPARMIPFQTARVADLRHGFFVMVTCKSCGHSAELAATHLRQRLPPDAFVRHLGPQFRCKSCRHKGADIDARRALGQLK